MMLIVVVESHIGMIRGRWEQADDSYERGGIPASYWFMIAAAFFGGVALVWYGITMGNSV
ncbi:hypothetical protein [Silvibacterium acidisoli]|uniref:hypothetical protein n=1 Tax=Acidobacteriaceae bacterium ZG23-2 TaxID=2883246 RepID=UPI00406CFCAB